MGGSIYLVIDSQINGIGSFFVDFFSYGLWSFPRYVPSLIKLVLIYKVKHAEFVALA